MISSMKTKDLESIVGGLSNPSKMPGYAYSLPAKECITGARLREVKGSTCSGCYAMKGFYSFPKVQAALYRRLESLDDPRWVDTMIELISRKSKKVPYFRWHDSGDLQSVEHLKNIVKVVEGTSGVIHWLPTREYRIVKDFLVNNKVPKNLTIRMSAHMIGGQIPSFTKPLTISTVSKSHDYKKAHNCPAPSQGNECRDCRACWNPKVSHVDYHLH